MTTGLTYIAASGVSTWGGSPSNAVSPRSKTTNTFSKVQLVVHKCFTYINVSDYTYAVMSPTPPSGSLWDDFYFSMDFGHAGDCGNEDGLGWIDLTQTDFKLHPGVSFDLLGGRSVFRYWVEVPDFKSNRQRAEFKMHGYCSSTWVKLGSGLAVGLPVIINEER